MAIGIFEQQDTKVGILFGNAASTPSFTATSGILSLAYAGLPLETSVVFNKNVNERLVKRMNGKRNYTREDSPTDLKGSNPTASMTMPATYATLDLILACVFQDVTEDAVVGVYGKTFDIPTSYPDFSTSSGAYVSLVKSYPSGIGNYDEYMNSCIARKVTLSCYPEQNEGRLTVSVDWLGRYHSYGNYSGTLTYPTSFGYWNFADLDSVEIAGSAVLCSGFTITMELNATPKPVGGVGAIGTQTYGLHWWDVTGSIDVEHTSVTAPRIAYEGTDTSYLTEITWGTKTGANSGDLYFSVPTAVYNSHSYKGNQNDIRTLNFRAQEKVAATATKMFTCIMANGIDRGAVHTSLFWTM